MHKNLGKKRKTTGVEFCCNAQLFNAVILNTTGRFACVQVLKLSFFKRNEIINCVVFVL